MLHSGDAMQQTGMVGHSSGNALFVGQERF